MSGESQFPWEFDLDPIPDLPEYEFGHTKGPWRVLEARSKDLVDKVFMFARKHPFVEHKYIVAETREGFEHYHIFKLERVK